ncbi:GNAT family protein [Streptomyces sp. NPDC049585]|uniref:GNAT family N-acetyltransferase n=1 Tax=Streptomyces sp. NPDC049585 TaxID=3155154 RepID=UPI003431F5BD
MNPTMTAEAAPVGSRCAGWFDRPVLAGLRVRLEPLSPVHAEGLLEAGDDPQVWRWLPVRRPGDPVAMRAYVAELLGRHRDGLAVPWAQIDVRTGRVAGVTAFRDLAPGDRGLHIGHTWLGARWQRTGINTEAKLMLLERAFDVLGAIRVSWTAHPENQQTLRAIERLGARRDGVLRRHRIMPDGTYRDTVVYSLIDSEWPAARDALRARLRGGPAGQAAPRRGEDPPDSL